MQRQSESLFGFLSNRRTMTACKVYFLLLLASYAANECNGYFGLTRKTQLSDLWSINMDAASLATANHFESWETDTDGPQPSLSYKPVQMRTDVSKTLAKKRKRASRSRQKSQSRNEILFDQSHQRSSSNQGDGLYSKRGNSRRNSRQHNSNHRPGNYRLRNNLQSQERKQSLTRLQNRLKHRRVPGSHVDREHSNPADRRNSSQHPRQRVGNLPSSPGSDEFLDQGAEFNSLARDLAVLMNMSHSTPRIRNGRESGKRRDLIGVSRKPQQYLIASSVSRSPSPSQVRFRGGEGYPREIGTRRKVTTKRPATRRNRTISKEAARNFFHFNENVLNSHSILSGNQAKNATTGLLESQRIDRKEARKLCDGFKLTAYQRRKCKKDPGLPQVLAKATHIAAAECMYRFRYSRWNCSLGTSRLHLLNRGNKETAFLYSISSAGLTHSVARACAEGHLESCSCEETFADQVNQEAWLWGGCGDNVHFAARFVKKFLRSHRVSTDVRSEIDRHNSDLGIRFVRSNVHQTCKCHGVSGSCTTKSCWRKMAPFYDIGKKIKRAYDRAVKVENTSNTSAGRPKLVRIRTRHRRQKPDRPSSSSSRRRKGTNRRNEKNPKFSRNNHRTRSASESSRTARHEVWADDSPKKKELVYLENSPRYCRKTRYSLGTKGRICGKEKNCRRMCCGRGFTTHLRIIRRSCQCQVKWCCYVKCKTCNERKRIRTCK